VNALSGLSSDKVCNFEKVNGKIWNETAMFDFDYYQKSIIKPVEKPTESPNPIQKPAAITTTTTTSLVTRLTDDLVPLRKQL